MRNKLILVLLVFLATGIVCAWEIEDINGTWVKDEETLKYPATRGFFYWGRGWVIVHSSVAFDLEPKEIRAPGEDLHIIDEVYKDEQDRICFTLYALPDKEHKFPVYMRIRFIDLNRIYIVCDRWQKTRLDDAYSSEETRIWYRLSGPPRN